MGGTEPNIEESPNVDVRIGVVQSPKEIELELPDGTDAAEVLQIVTAQIYYRLLIAGEQPGHGIADRAAATAVAAVRANVS